MARKPKQGKKSKRLAQEIARRQADTIRVPARREEQRIRVMLTTAVKRSAWEQRLDAAMKVTDDFAWKPWGYEIPVAGPKLALIRSDHTRTPVRARSRWDATRYPNLQRVMAVAA